MRGRALRYTTMAVLGLLAGCSAIRLDRPLAEAAPARFAPPLAEVWQVTAESGFGPSPLLVRGDLLLVGTRGGDLRAYDVATGRSRGHADLDAPLEGAFAADERTVYVPVSMRRRGVVAYDVRDGGRRWKAGLGPHDAGVLLAGEYVLAAERNGVLRALDRRSGDAAWTRSLDTLAGLQAGLVALGPHRALASLDDGRLVAFDPRTGQTVWEARAGAPVYETPGAGEGMVVAPTTRGTLAAFDAQSGEPVWTVDADAPTLRFATPLVYGGRVFVGGSDGVLRCLDLYTGDERWRFRSDGNFASAPAVVGDVVYAGTLSDTLYAFALDTGERVWEVALRGRMKSAPVAAGDRLIVATEPSHLTAFGPAAGQEP